MKLFKVVQLPMNNYSLEIYKDKFYFHPNANKSYYEYDYLYNVLQQENLENIIYDYDIVEFKAYSIKNRKAFKILKKKWLAYIITGDLNINVLGNRNSNYLIFNGKFITLDELCYDNTLTYKDCKKMMRDIEKSLVLNEDYSINEISFYFKKKSQAMDFIHRVENLTKYQFGIDTLNF
jgi:hypothetical protein